MQTGFEEVASFLKDRQNSDVEGEAILKMLKQFKHLGRDTALLEIGTGTGMFQILCKKEGIRCEGLELSADLVEHARNLGQKHGIELDIQIGNIEEADLQPLKYDVVVATSVFEHVENWQSGLRKVFDTLKPGGLFYFYSTNKFSFVQGEYDFPFYCWMPDSWRYRLRVARQGPEIMKWGIDFNQFTYFGLRRQFKKLGFSRILDLVDVLDPDHLNNPTATKKVILRVLKAVRPLKHLVLFFSNGTLFICVK